MEIASRDDFQIASVPLIDPTSLETAARSIKVEPIIAHVRGRLE
jgi:hypothetical protein